MAANKIYELVIAVGREAFARHILYSVENPANSYFWQYPGMQQMIHECGMADVTFHGCMHGGHRDRLCRWSSTGNFLGPLHALCDKQHQHKPWSMQFNQGRWTFPTAEEAEYPRILTDKIALLVARTWKIELDLNPNMGTAPVSSKLRPAQGGKPPRGSTVHHLLTEM